MGLAASAAIRGSVMQRELGSPVTPQDLHLLAITAGHSSTGLEKFLRTAFTDAFMESMVVCTVVAGVCVVVSTFTFRRNPTPPAQRREANLVHEIRRLKEEKAKISKQHSGELEESKNTADVSV